MADQPFYRIGSPVRIPFTGSSAATPFDLTGRIPTNGDGSIINDLSFMFSNLTTYDVRLEGTPKGLAFVPVTVATGWPIAARTSAMGPFTSKKPMSVSVQAFSSQGIPVASDADFTGCYIEIIYGRGR